MNKHTVVTYTAAGRSVTFYAHPRSPLWITALSGASANEVTVSESQSAGQVGSSIGSLSVQPRDLTVEGAIRADLEANRRGLLACVLPGVQGRLTVTQSGESWYIDGVPTKTPDISDGSAVQQFQFVLHCPYPYWRSTADGSTQVAGLTKKFRFPCSLAGRWYISQYSASLFTVVENAGSAAMEFEAVFRAVTEVTDPELYHVERGTFLRIHKTLAAGESITVSTLYGKKGATLRLPDGTEQNAFRYLDVDSDLNLQLDPGPNTLRTAAGANREGLRVEIIIPKGVLAGL